MRLLLYSNRDSRYGYYCSECNWTFRPRGILLGSNESYSEMLQRVREQCEEEFRLHLCINHRNLKGKTKL